jgi:hypothetical protein
MITPTCIIINDLGLNKTTTLYNNNEKQLVTVKISNSEELINLYDIAFQQVSIINTVLNTLVNNLPIYMML